MTPSTGSRPIRPHGRRSRGPLLVTAVIAIALVPLVVLAIVSPQRSGGKGAAGSRPQDTPAGCETEQVEPFTCSTYRITAPDLSFVEVSGWFDSSDGRPRLVLEMSEQLHLVPVRLEGDRGVTGDAGAWTSTARKCADDSECALEQQLADAFRDRTELTRTRDGFAAKGSALRFEDTGSPHRYAEVTARTSGRFTLLTVPPSDARNTAFDGGRLTRNEAGCLTDGDAVLVLPSTARLHDDGSIEIEGRRIRPGEALDIGGGLGPVPGDQRCGLGTYWYL